MAERSRGTRRRASLDAAAPEEDKDRSSTRRRRVPECRRRIEHPTARRQAAAFRRGIRPCQEEAYPRKPRPPSLRCCAAAKTRLVRSHHRAARLAAAILAVAALLATRRTSPTTTICRRSVVGAAFFAHAFVVPTEPVVISSRSAKGCSAFGFDPRSEIGRKRRRERERCSSSALPTLQSTSRRRFSASASSDPTRVTPTDRQRRGGNNSTALSESALASCSPPGAVEEKEVVAIRTTSSRASNRPRISSAAKSSASITRKWDRMVALLKDFRERHGHSFVSSELIPRRGGSSNKDMKELLLWTRSVRNNYRHQVLELQQQQQQKLARVGGSSLEVASQLALEGAEGLRCGAASEALVEDVNPSHGVAAATSSRRPRLSGARLRQLLELDFVWDAQRHAWESKYRQLVEFRERYGHCRVPNNSVEYPQLGVWVRNQRRERKKLLLQLPQHEHGEPASSTECSPAAPIQGVARSTLTPDRLRRLEALEFDWYRSHDDTWNDRYRQLQRYAQVHGHANVRQDDPQHFALGQWCMNQRTAYRRRQRQRREEESDLDLGEEYGREHGASKDSTNDEELTLTRIQRLERLGFSWHTRDDAWQTMMQRLVDYYREHGHVNIPTASLGEPTESPSRTADDRALELLRTWLNRQRHEYRRLQEGRPSPMTMERIRALEAAIPNFSWQVRGLSSGPSTEDWAKLFDAMRAKGLKPGMRPKSHWFEGAHPFRLSGAAAMATTKDVWTEQDLLALWNQESEEEEDDGDDVDLDLGPLSS